MSPLLPNPKLEVSFHINGGQTLESTTMIGLNLGGSLPLRAICSVVTLGNWRQ